MSTSVTLRRAARPTDLWAAVEAAQYASIVANERDLAGADAEAAGAFLARFDAYAEGWDEIAPAAQGSLEGLAAPLRVLAERGLSVYVATVERNFAPAGEEAVLLPVAVLRISRAAAPSETVHLPAAMRIATG